MAAPQREVFLVYSNSDMIEGKGPMVLDSIWTTREAAEARGAELGAPYSGHKWSDWHLVREFPLDAKLAERAK